MSETICEQTINFSLKLQLGDGFRHEFLRSNDKALVSAAADDAGLVGDLDLEDEAAAVDLDQGSGGGDIHADGRCGDVLHVQLRADGGGAFLKMGRGEGCGGGFDDGRLACLRLDDMKEFYSE